MADFFLAIKAMKSYRTTRLYHGLTRATRGTMKMDRQMKHHIPSIADNFSHLLMYVLLHTQMKGSGTSWCRCWETGNLSNMTFSTRSLLDFETRQAVESGFINNFTFWQTVYVTDTVPSGRFTMAVTAQNFQFNAQHQTIARH